MRVYSREGLGVGGRDLRYGIVVDTFVALDDEPERRLRRGVEGRKTSRSCDDVLKKP